MLIEFQLFRGMGQKIRCTEGRQCTDINLIDLFRVKDDTCHIDTVVLIEGTENSNMIFDNNGIQGTHQCIVIKVKINGLVCVDKIVECFQSLIIVIIKQCCVNTYFDMDRMLRCQMGIRIGRTVQCEPTDIQCAQNIQ